MFPNRIVLALFKFVLKFKCSVDELNDLFLCGDQKINRQISRKANVRVVLCVFN